MPQPLFKYHPSRILPKGVLKAKTERARVVGAIKRMCRERKERNIVPHYAQWRDLKDILTEDEMKRLDMLVKDGVIKAHRGIRWDSYEVDEPALVKYEAEMARIVNNG